MRISTTSAIARRTSATAQRGDPPPPSDFAGFLQTDAYAAYDSWADDQPGILRLSCWAHARRKFHEAFKLGQTLAAGPLAAIQGHYRIENGIRPTAAGKKP